MKIPTVFMFLHKPNRLTNIHWWRCLDSWSYPKVKNMTKRSENHVVIQISVRKANQIYTGMHCSLIKKFKHKHVLYKDTEMHVVKWVYPRIILHVKQDFFHSNWTHAPSCLKWIDQGIHVICVLNDCLYPYFEACRLFSVSKIASVPCDNNNNNKNKTDKSSCLHHLITLTIHHVEVGKYL